tara:strand:+ start:3304 stop:3621 length:318 start_codon:yes stop_codon:yes gene_type:complete
MTATFPRRSRRIQSMGPEITNDSNMNQSIYSSSLYLTNDNVTKIYDNGEIYRGQIRNGKRHGSGQMIYSNGVVYHGRWNDDIPNHVQITIYDESFLQMVHDVHGY